MRILVFFGHSIQLYLGAFMTTSLGLFQTSFKVPESNNCSLDVKTRITSSEDILVSVELKAVYELHRNLCFRQA